jgi:hypothetical protein
VVRAAGWHAGDPGSILGMDGLYTLGCIPQRFESVLVEVLRYIETLMYLFYFSAFYDQVILASLWLFAV